MDSPYFQLSVPNLVLAAFLLLALAGLVALLRPFLRWYLGIPRLEEAFGRLEGRVKRLQEMFEEEEDAPRGPALPRPGEDDGPGLPGPGG